MNIENTRKEIRALNCDLSKSHFNDVNLHQAMFTNVNLARAGFVDVNLNGATIEDANLTDMKINGLLVTDLLQAYESRPRAVLYAKDLARMHAFYRGVILFATERAETDCVVLASATSQLSIVQVPAPIAATIVISDPPLRRAEVPVKLIFEVNSIAVARDMAPKFGGSVDSEEHESTMQVCRVCDGVDPEGNIMQLRQKQRR